MLKKAIKGTNLHQIFKVNLKFATHAQVRLEKRLFAQRIKFYKDKFGMNMYSGTTISAPYAAMGKVRPQLLIGAGKIKVFVKNYQNEIAMHMTQQQRMQATEGHGVVRLAKTRFKITPSQVDLEVDHLSWTGQGLKHGTFTKSKRVVTDFSKTKVKTRFGPDFKKSIHGVDDLLIFYRKMKRMETDLAKLKMKALNFTVMKSTSKNKKLKQLKEKMRYIDSFLGKKILKQIQFVNVPNAPKDSGLTAAKLAVVEKLKSFSKKLKRFGKVVLKSVAFVRRPDDVFENGLVTKSRLRKVFKSMQKFKNYKTFKKAVLFAGTSGGNKKREYQVERLRTAYRKAKLLVQGKRFSHNYEELKKIILFGTNTGGNKKKENEVEHSQLSALKRDEQEHRQKQAQKVLEMVKVFLAPGVTPGNKKLTKEALYRRFVGDLVRKSSARSSGQVKFAEFKKLYLKFYESVSAPKFFRAEMKAVREWFKQGLGMKNLQEFRKVVLLKGTTPGNKKTDKETERYSIRVQREIKGRLQSMSQQIDTTSKVLLKTENSCCCCCEFLVHECCDEEEEAMQAELEEEEETLNAKTDAFFEDDQLVDSEGHPLDEEMEEMNGLQAQNLQKEREQLRAIARGDYEDMARFSRKQVFEILELDPRDPRGWGWEDIDSQGHLYLEHQAQARLQDIEAFKFDCRIRAKHRVYNILPDVSFNLSYKKSNRSYFRRDKELTTVDDVEPIIDRPGRWKNPDLEKIYAQTNKDYDYGRIQNLDPPTFKNHREFYKPVNLEGDDPAEKVMMLEIDGRRPDFENEVRGDPFMGKDFHEEHHLTRQDKDGIFLVKRDGNTIDMRRR